MKILITGGNGYLGKKISKFLADKGFKIKILDKITSEDYESYKVDIINDNLIKYFEDVDAVIHLIGIDIHKSKEDPELAFKINALGTKSVLEAAKNVKKFIYMSTFHVYGKPEGIVTEETKTNPINDYAITKLKGEEYCREYNNTIIIRLSNTYGMSDNLGMNLVFNDLCNQAVKDKKIVLRSKGKQKRDFVSINDVCQAIDILLEKDVKGTFNVGGKTKLSIYELAELIVETYKEIYNQQIQIKVNEDIDEQTKEFTYDISKIEALGFKIKANIKEEIKKTLEYF